MSLTFRLFGIPIRITAWFLLTGLLIWNGTFGPAALPIVIAIVFQAILMHELGHALVGRAFGLTPAIELGFLSGLTTWEERRELPPGKSILVSLAGPMVGIVLGTIGIAAGFALGLFPSIENPENWTLGQYAMVMFTFANLIWSLFNLVPVVPLDGGQIMIAAFRKFGGEKGILYAHYVSLFVLGLVFLFGVFSKMFFLVIFMGLFGYKNWEVIRMLRARQEAGLQGDVIEPKSVLVARGESAIVEGRGEVASACGQALVARAESHAERDEALHMVAWGEFLAGRLDRAWNALHSLSGERTPDPSLAGAILVKMGKHPLALDPLETALLQAPDEFVRKRYVEAVIGAEAFERANAFIASAQIPFPASELAKIQG